MIGIAIPAVWIDRKVIARCYKALADARVSIAYRVRIYRGPMPDFNLAKARNHAIIDLLGHCDKIICLDVDCLVPPGLVEHAAKTIENGRAVVALVRNIDNFSGEYQWDEWKSLPVRKTGLGAFVGMTTGDWLRIGGWDERCEGWGGEDYALAEQRNHLGIETVFVDSYPLVHVSHGWRMTFGCRRGHENLKVTRNSERINWLTNRVHIPESMMHLHLFVTTACGAFCPHCNQRGIMKQHFGYHMSLDEIKKLIEATAASGYGPFRDVIVSGGEPLLWNNLEDGIRMLFEAKIGPIRIFTNGLHCVPETIVPMVKEFRVSRYDWNQQSVQSLREKLGKKIRVVNRQKHFHVPLGRYGLETLPEECGGQGCVVFQGKIYPCCNAMSTPLWLQDENENIPSCDIQPGYRELTLFNLKRMSEFCRGCIGNKKVQQWLESA